MAGLQEMQSGPSMLLISLLYRIISAELLFGNNTMKQPDKILIVRNDKLGDFMLIWPAVSLLKKQFPQATIIALVNRYTEPMASLCPWIDDVIMDVTEGSGFFRSLKLSALIRDSDIDISISFFSTMHTALAIWLAGVSVRIAPATKLAQIFYNRRLRQKRSRSEKPEYLYNIDLVEYLVSVMGRPALPVDKPPYLKFEAEDSEAIRRQFKKDNGISEQAKLVFLHPGSGGSAPALNQRQFAALIDRLSVRQDWFFVITAGPGELELATRVAELAETDNKTVYESTSGLNEFSLFLSIADLFFSGSTGVLHIAGALDVPTVAFYTRRQSATSLRWQTLNSTDRRLSFSPPMTADAEDMQSIDVDVVAHEVLASRLVAAI